MDSCAYHTVLSRVDCWLASMDRAGIKRYLMKFILNGARTSQNASLNTTWSVAFMGQVRAPVLSASFQKRHVRLSSLWPDWRRDCARSLDDAYSRDMIDRALLRPPDCFFGVGFIGTALLGIARLRPTICYARPSSSNWPPGGPKPNSGSLAHVHTVV